MLVLIVIILMMMMIMMMMAMPAMTIMMMSFALMIMIIPIMTLTEAARKLYAPQGHALKTGDHFSNPPLARFLAGLPDSAEDFYYGSLAEQMTHTMREQGGLLTREDLSRYQVIERQPLRYAYRDVTLITNPAPSLGGGLIALELDLLTREPHNLSGRVTDNAEHAAALARCLLETDRLRRQGIVRPSNVAGDDIARPQAPRGTTHMSVCDSLGNAASLTLTAGEGAGHLAADTGIMYNNMLGEDDLFPDGFHQFASGVRVASMMAPSMLQDASGQVRLVLGTGGSKRIRTALWQVISHIVDSKLTLPEAVAMPRMHWDGETLQLEPGFAPAVLAALTDIAPVNLWQAKNLYFGGVHAVQPKKGIAAGDSRRGGSSAVR
jgi:gamma-glutamyltranspeptidase/glutathione hydrolase